ncbi:MAG TPA: hypothetical protein VGJ29_10130 [Vicinamibacterales bacterium]
MRRIDDVRDEVIAGNDRRRLTLGLPRGPSRGRADLKHLRAMTEAEIRKTAPAELANLPRDFWKDAVLVRPGPRGKRKR